MTTAQTSPIVFLDTETTGLHPERRPWEIAMIRRDARGERELLIQVSGVDLSQAEPKGLQVGGFYDRHLAYRPRARPLGDSVPAGFEDLSPIREQDAREADIKLLAEPEAATLVEEWTRGAHLIGAVPDFDARTLDPMLRRHGLIPAWHYHLIDIEAMAAGWLSAWEAQPRRWVTGTDHDAAQSTALAPGAMWTIPEPAADGSLVGPPYRSDDLSRACGVEPPAAVDRHTAMGDARWVQRWYDTITGFRHLTEGTDRG